MQPIIMSSQPPPGVAASLATASASASASASSSPASLSASASASSASASPASPRQLSSSPHSSTASTSTNDTVTYATYYSASSSSAAAAAAAATAPAATYSNDQLRLLSLSSHDAIDPTAAISLGHRHPHSSLEDTITNSLPAFSVPEAISSAADPDTAMIFSDFYKGARSPLSRLRSQNSQMQHQSSADSPPWLSADYEDLLSKDKFRQKDAIKRYLAAKVKTSWDFQWSPARKSERKTAQKPTGTHGQKNASMQDAEPEAIRVDSAKDMRDEAPQDAEIAVSSSDLSEGPSDHEDIDDDNDDDTDSVYSIVSEDVAHYRPRMDWYSDLSDDEAAINSLDKLQATDNATKISILEKRALRRRAARDEMAWNEGLACFEARRNAWTEAKTVRVRSKPTPSSPPVSPRSPRRFFFRRSISGSPPSPSMINPISPGDSQSGAISDSSSIAKDDRDLKTQSSRDSDRAADLLLPVETLLPIPHPILPPNNSFRASITPAIYLSLYDKVILNNMQPSCPINLSDMIRACVTGWKRDGEWPPKPSAPEPSVVTMRRKKAKKAAAAANGSSIGMTARRMSFGLLGREKDDEFHAGTGIRKSIQKALGLGAQPEGSRH